ncbi:TVP38/TMEM64 family protein [Magnetospira sp. QH-2]|uniref:TVP38/TMEM64 family protein n=1 Tax=Magnetospira sp. (strain QH-2) TaxID=1288970 RepID=UPI0003E816C1|nr:TVP38/TMEM64 family protein [Magnetospira sp. QH-2]CCQ72114.1 conserved hypothetical protein of unknown function [Magnetospira sp. QH-2]
MSDSVAASPKKARLSVKRLLPLFVIAAGFAAFFAFGLHNYFTWQTLADNRTALMEWKNNNMVFASAALVVIYAVVVALSLPVAALITPVAGFLFGLMEGALYSLVGATIGAVAVFFAARYALADFFHARAGKALHRMEDGFKENALSYMLVLRLVPLFPFFLVNLVPGLLGVPFRAYLIGTVIGMIPGAFVYASVGNGLGAVFDAGETPDMGIIFQPAVFGPILGIALLALIPVAYKEVQRRRKKREAR